MVAGACARKKEQGRQNVDLWDREFSTPLPPDALYDTIVGVSSRVPELVYSITGRDISWFSRKN
jgi:hypothetical protein